MPAGGSADLNRLWDVIIVGTGIGGATAGCALAQDGHSVLFLEKGGLIEAGDAPGDAVAATPEERLAAGWWPYPVSQRRESGGCDRFFAPVGCAVGGSSIHYAAALERMARSDFAALETPRQCVAPWCAGFDEFESHYERAEKLYGLVPGGDPAAATRLSAWDRALLEAMRANGLSPGVLNVAMRYDEDCRECVGRVCPRKCKFDARTACLDAALARPSCALLDRCDVQSLDADSTRVHVVRAMRDGRPLELRARVVVLSAGAWHSPQILLRSRNTHWPAGLANRSGQVGRNLMFHTADIYALWAPRRYDRQGRQKKALSVRDFYNSGGRRLGYVQSMGLDAGRGVIALHLKELLRQRGFRSELLLKLLAWLPARAAAAALGDASIFAAMTEDDPNPDNRIELDPAEPDGTRFSYTITPELRERADALRQAFARAVRPWRLVRISPSLSMNHGHPCGTCRFGDDPATSVLDRDCRAHDVENLYVIDASFMPRSGAVNPSLTIAANALRVAPSVSRAVTASSRA